MRTFFLVSLIAATISIILIIALKKQNQIASDNKESKSYITYNWEKPEVSQAIMNYWRAEEYRKKAIKNLGLLDYAFMIVYASYLIFCLIRRIRKEHRLRLKIWLKIAVGLILFCLLLDAVQDFINLSYISNQAKVMDMRYFTYPKWTTFLLGVLPLVISILPLNFARFMSQVLKSIWLFFPGLLFLLLAIFCFWILGQGKDLIVAFVDNTYGGLVHPAPLFFFIIIAFWVYVSWYSSRIIAYIKKKQQKQKLIEIKNIDTRFDDDKFDDDKAEEAYISKEHLFEISKPFLDAFPRLIGNGCFLVLELAVLQSPILFKNFSVALASVILVSLLVALGYLNKYISRRLDIKKVENPEQKSFTRFFWILFGVLIAYVIFLSFYTNIISLIVLLLLFHTVFIYYINLRRNDLERKAPAAREEKIQEEHATRFERVMDFFCIPRREKGYFKWFLIIAATGIFLYFINIFYLWFARLIGPFPTVILAFAILLTFGNIVTAFSVRYKINFHLLFFLLALIISGFHETHYVRTTALPGKNNKYDERPKLEKYLTKWLDQRQAMLDTSKDGYDIYFIMSNGGASRSGYWTALILDSLEDASLKLNRGRADKSRFSDHVFCLSGTSGGGVGVAAFFALLRNRPPGDSSFTRSARHFLKQDYFSYTFARFLGPDFFSYILSPFISKKDRAAALEESFEQSSEEKNGTPYRVPFNDNFSNFTALKENGDINLPIVCINTTRMQDGNPGVVTNLCLDSATFNNRVDVLKLLDKGYDISMASAAILGARFPYLSPAGRIQENYFVDGGYFDNSGAGVVQEMIRGILNIGKNDSSKNRKLYQQISKLNFKVLHITNSPVIADSTNITSSVAPIKNDLLAPVLTILGAYDMQTTVNDKRLMNYIKDINSDSSLAKKADYTLFPLYKDSSELKFDKKTKRYETESPYAMNWFISDTTRLRIDQRLTNSKALTRFIKDTWLNK